MYLKSGVEFAGAKAPVAIAIMVIDQLFRDRGHTLTVTSICDDAPGRLPTSFHPKGLAFDIRIWDFDEDEVEVIAQDIRDALGAEWDVVVKSDHIHCECDPDD